MFEGLCIYFANNALTIKLGCFAWATLFAGGGSVALMEARDRKSARQYGFVMLFFGMVAMLFPDSATWQSWLELTRRP